MNVDWPPAGTLMASRYRLVSRLETGGMAQIWHADDELLDRPVALKLPAGLDPAGADVLHLAWKEARMAARLSHPNIAAVHDYNAAMRPEGYMAPFVVMELLAGESLAARLNRSSLPWQESAQIGVAVADALTAAHANGVVHRDIKPGNVMLTPTGVKILDFGISATTGEPDDDETGATFGTPAYVAPERLDGKPAEPATDVYGLGVLLYEMVTGQPPYPVDTWEELDAARTVPPRALPADLPAAFRDLVEACLREEPDRRPTAAHVRHGLATLTPPVPAPRRPVRRRLALFSGLTALVVSIIALFAALGSSRQMPDAAGEPSATLADGTDYEWAEPYREAIR
ncbi:serine/threonine-protein kinase, partial [Actinoplanes sp. NPDC026623]|uniref:serine/threonine-protein kinase n=1 Tax=Actinoplanes sp. NPDC026623 TaxID=3155610 RepID=UPI0033CC65E4